MENKQTNRNSALGLLLVALGFLLFAGQNFQTFFSNLFENWNLPYTVYIVVPGIVLIVVGMIGKRTLTLITILGSITLVSGLLLAFQDATEGYQTWAYVWALVFPGSLGLGLALQSIVTEDEQQRTTGLRMLGVALLITLVGWSFFEGIVHLSGYQQTNALANAVGPLLLVALGGWILLRRRALVIGE
jgi:hypothetical protein